MGKVSAIDRSRKTPKGAGYYVSRLRAPSLDDVPFLLTALIAIAVALVICFAIGGPVSLWLFVIIVQAGVNFGLLKFILSPTIFASSDESQEDDPTKQLKLS